MERKLLNSTTFKFCLIVLAAGAIAAYFSTELTWAVWFEKAVYFVGIYASKEGLRYGAAAYQGKQNAS